MMKPRKRQNTPFSYPCLGRGGRGRTNFLSILSKIVDSVDTEERKASLVSRVSWFTEEKGKRGMSTFSFNPLFNTVPCSPLSLLINKPIKSCCVDNKVLMRCVFVLHLTGFNFTRSTVLTVGTMGRIETEMEAMSLQHTISK